MERFGCKECEACSAIKSGIYSQETYVQSFEREHNGTLPEISITPENRPSEKQTSIPMYSNHSFSGLC